ncbi:MAG: ABC transporter substrate-binding protein [Chloroflexota bacterium]
MQIKFMRIITAMFISMLLLLTACAPVSQPETQEAASSESSQANEPKPITLGVGFIPNVQFATYYVGIEKGFYADEGLDVSLDYGYENDYLKLVGTGEWDFMVGSGDQVILGRAQGLPVRYVMNWYTQYPVVLFAKTEMNITHLDDIEGKTIGIPGPFGATYVAYRGLLDAANLTEVDVTTESIGFTQAAAVSEGTVDAAMDYGVNGPVVLAQAGIETTQIKLDDYIRIPANGLVTNDMVITDNPELVQSMVRGTLNAIAYTLENPDEAFEIALKFVPEAGGDNEAANRAVFDAVLDYWTPQDGYSMGESRYGDWETAVELMWDINMIDDDVEIEDLFTNVFVGEYK